MDLHKTLGVLALTIAIVAGVSGCAGSQPDTTVAPAATSAGEPVEFSPPVESADPVDPGTAAGAYVAYSDGIIAKTAGTKVLFFHASWCPKCRALEKDINAGPIPPGVTIAAAPWRAVSSWSAWPRAS